MAEATPSGRRKNSIPSRLGVSSGDRSCRKRPLIHGVCTVALDMRRRWRWSMTITTCRGNALHVVVHHVDYLRLNQDANCAIPYFRGRCRRLKLQRALCRMSISQAEIFDSSEGNWTQDLQRRWSPWSAPTYRGAVKVATVSDIQAVVSTLSIFQQSTRGDQS
jgi:hypothetical protein